jgi:CheY-like chemotaxis protein
VNNASTNHGSVLIAEDDLDLRREMAEILMDEGYDVLQADNGAAALDVLDRGARLCVVLLDLMMPVMDGFEFLAELESRSAAVPVVILSGDAKATGLTAERNVKRVLRKPVSLDTFLDAVRAYC